MRRNPRHVRFDDARRVLEDNGFIASQPGTGSSHWTFTHSALQLTVVLVYRRPFLLRVYVRNALDALAQLEDDEE